MIYPENFESKIGFDRIRQILSEFCLSPMGLDQVASAAFSSDPGTISQKLDATWEFQQLLRFEDNFPSEHYYRITDCLNNIRIPGSFPEVNEVFDLKRSLETVKSIISFFKRKEGNSYPVLRSLCGDVKIYPFVLEAADRIIDRNGAVRENASPALRDIRDQIGTRNALVTRRLTAILKMAQAEGIVDSDTVASVRNGRGVIPVNTGDKKKIKGLIHDQSASGKTVYIEPAEIVELNNEIVELEYEERREIVRILTAFADSIRPYIDDLLASNSFLGEIDFIRAKARFGNQLDSVKPVIAEKPALAWMNARHPLLSVTFSRLKDRKVVPLDIALDQKSRILLISGPNAGGKSVCLKTVGLLQYMFQCGLTIPVREGSESGIFRDIFIDIGDEQSIENDLSTYSSHLLSMKFFVKNASPDTLILIDEFGTGTEPMLGGSIAEAILGELNRTGVFGVVTTHYTNLKHFASVTEGIVNGAMLFDNHLMQPLFRLSIGKPGSSFAFEIARKIGLPEDILKTASEKAGVKNINYDRHLKDIARDKRYWEGKRQSIRQHEKRLEELIGEYEKELAGARSLRKEIISKAKEEAEMLLNDSNRVIEGTIRQIREAQAEKEKTREARRKIEELRAKVTGITDVSETPGEERVVVLKRKAEKIRPREEVTKRESEIQPARPLAIGDAVRITDTRAAGEVVKIEGEMVTIETGNLRMVVPSERVIRISRAELRKEMKLYEPGRQADPVVESRKLNFRPEIDIRGVRGDEALVRVRDFIDDALVVRHRDLRILHGKGNGILRNLVRDYLSSSDVVRSYRDEQVDFGGSGITVVELDL